MCLGKSPPESNQRITSSTALWRKRASDAWVRAMIGYISDWSQSSHVHRYQFSPQPCRVHAYRGCIGSAFLLLVRLILGKRFDVKSDLPRMFAKMMSWQSTITLSTGLISIFSTSFMSRIPILDWHPYLLWTLTSAPRLRVRSQKLPRTEG